MATTRHCTYWLASAPVLHLLRSKPGATLLAGARPAAGSPPCRGRPRAAAPRRGTAIRRVRRRSRFRRPPPPDADVVLVSICIPSLKVIALSVASVARSWLSPAGSALHTTIQACPRLPKFLLIAHTTVGDLRGTVEGGVAVWRGVPTREQPVGERRFAAPAPLLPWTGVRDAVEHGPLPLQSRSLVAGDRNDPKVRDEACLTVTVWSPDVSGSLPVMVWIPGGAFLNGAGQLQLYNGSRLAANGDVVVVNVTYRVGVFGGFELGDLGEGFDDNLCLRDQIAALRLGARQHRRVRRRSQPGHRVRRIRRRHFGIGAAGQPGRRRAVRPGDRAEPSFAADRRPRDAGRAGAASSSAGSGVRRRVEA